jgi:Flp pilus assembly protein TadD
VAEQGEEPGFVYDLYQQGRRHLDRGNPGGAAEVLELAVEHEPEKASLHELLGRAYFGTARIRKARAQFVRALELDPTDAYAHFGVGRCFEREGNLPEAHKYYKLACALDGRADYRSALERVRRRLDNGPSRA